MKTTFSISDSFKRAFELMKKHFSFLVIATLIYSVLYLLLSQTNDRGVVSLIFGIASSILSIIFTIGLYRIALLVEAGGTPKAEDFKTDLNTFLSFLWSSIIFSFFVVVGLVLLIIPGFIVMVRLSMTYYLLIDKKLSGWDAIKQSWAMTKGYGWKIMGFFVCSMIIFIIAVIPFGLGLLFAMPFIAITHAVIYRTVLGQKGGSDEVEIITEPLVVDNN